jgi:hypothetical protein
MTISNNQFMDYEKITPDQKDFRDFNNMLSRRGTGLGEVSINGVDSNDNNKYSGPFTVKIKHDDGYEDEIKAERHSTAMKKAALTVADNYAPEHKSPELLQTLEKGEMNANEFNESLRPKVHNLLDEHSKTWAKRRARLIGIINSAIGTKLGPLDLVQTPEIESKFEDKLPGEVDVRNHEARHAFRTIAGYMPGGTRHDNKYIFIKPKSLTDKGIEDENTHFSPTHGGDILSGFYGAGYNYALDTRNWQQVQAEGEADHNSWKDNISKGLFHGGEEKKNALINTGKFNPEVPYKKSFEEAVGVSNPYRNDSFEDKGLTPIRESKYEMYDGSGNKIHSGVIATTYAARPDSGLGPKRNAFYAGERRFNSTIIRDAQ